MVARQDHHVFRFITADNVEVLGDRICGAAIPVFPFHSLLCWQQIDKLVHFFIEECPAALNVLHQSVGLVLGDHAHTTDPGVDAVRQRKVDNAELTAEVYGRFCSLIG